MGVCNLVPPITQTPAETFATLQSYFFVLFSQIILKLGYCVYFRIFFQRTWKIFTNGSMSKFWKPRWKGLLSCRETVWEQKRLTVNQWFIEEMLLLSIFFVSYFSCLFICHIRSVFKHVLRSCLCVLDPPFHLQSFLVPTVKWRELKNYFFPQIHVMRHQFFRGHSRCNFGSEHW